MMATLLGSIGGVLMAATGGVGAIAVVPLTMFGMHLSVHQSIAFSIVLVGFTALFGLLPRAKTQRLHWQVAFWVALGGVLAVPLGAQLSFIASETILIVSFSLLMLIVGAMVFWQAQQLQKVRYAQSYYQPPVRFETIQQQWPMLFFIGIAAGFLSGLFGIGGGFILVPALVYGLGMAVPHAIGTSLLIILPLALTGAMSHLSHINVDRMVLLSFLLGSVGGVWLGAFVPRSKLREPTLRLFALLLCVGATWLMLKQITMVTQA